MSEMRNKIILDLNRIFVIDYKYSKVKTILFFFSSLRFFITSPGFRAIFLYRILYKLQKEKRGILKSIFLLINSILTSIEISPTAEIEGGLLIPHAQCIVIGSGVKIGKNVGISQGVTIGASFDKEIFGRKFPIIGDNVWIGAGAKVLGPVIVGDNSIIGANAVVVNDIENDSIVGGVPAKIIYGRSATN